MQVGKTKTIPINILASQPLIKHCYYIPAENQKPPSHPSRLYVIKIYVFKLDDYKI
jgi:hypothetical protein